jgi:hypothetical protein
VDDVSTSPVLSQTTANGSTVTLKNIGTNVTVTITEELTVRERVNVTHNITGNVTTGRTTMKLDPVSVTVVNQTDPQQPQSVVDEYDTDGSGDITITELGRAGADFARGELTITELGRLGAAFAS